MISANAASDHRRQLARRSISSYPPYPRYTDH